MKLLNILNDRRVFYPTLALAGAVALATIAALDPEHDYQLPREDQLAVYTTAGEAPALSEPIMKPYTAPEPSDPEPETLRMFPGFEDPVYSTHDQRIIKWTDHWNNEYSQFSDLPGYESLDPNLVKSMVLQESAGDLNGAWEYDPLQFSDEGGVALGVMKSGSEHLLPEGGFEELHGILRTPKMRGRNNYDNPEGRITADLSIKYGIRWLMHKNSKWDTQLFEEGDVLTYVVQSGDSLDSIAHQKGTTVGSILKYTHLKDPDRIDVGDEIHYRAAERRTVPIGFRSLRQTLTRYNGSSYYAAQVLARLEPPEPGIFIVPQGATLSEIAEELGIPMRELAEMNGITNPANITAGQELRTQ